MTGIKKALVFAAGTLLPVLVFAVAYPRVLRVSWVFFGYLLTLDLVIYLTFGMVFSFAVFVLLSWRARVEVIPVLNEMTRLFGNVRWMAYVVVIVLMLPLIPYSLMHYRYFSEVYFQTRVMDHLSRQNYVAAAASCRTYVELYPQRRRKGAIPDPVCVPLLRFMGRVEALDIFLQKTSVKPRVVDDFRLPVEWNAKLYARQMTGVILGRRHDLSKVLDAQAVAPMAVSLPDWPLYSGGE